MSKHDKQMPLGWHAIKSVLLTEMQTAQNFHLCQKCASALFHARLLGESIAESTGMQLENGQVVGSAQEADSAPPHPAERNQKTDR